MCDFDQVMYYNFYQYKKKRNFIRN